MSHVRQQIRERVVSDLTGLTTTGANVSANRVYPYSPDHLPALNILTDAEERIDDDETMGNDQYRVLTLTLEARAIGDNDLDDTLDTILSEVEAALAADPDLNGLVRYLNYEGVEIDLQNDGEQLIGLATMTYTVEYAVVFGNAETAI